jgi:hypothetical protein
VGRGDGEGNREGKGMKINRKGNAREGKNEFLHLFVQKSRQGLEGKRGMGRMVG